MLTPGLTLRALRVRVGAKRNIYALEVNGRCRYGEFVEVAKSSDPKVLKKLSRWLDEFAQSGTIPFHNAIKKLKGAHADGIYEIRCKDWRVLFFYDRNDGSTVLISHAFVKDQNDTPPGEIARAAELCAAYHASTHGS